MLGISEILIVSYLTMARQAYNHFLRSFKDSTVWVAVIDLDEFLVPSNPGNTIRAVLRKYHTDQVHIPHDTRV